MLNLNLDKIQKIIGYNFKDKTLLKNAFIHSSYANESHEKSNERLEFLGDSVLSLIVTGYIYKHHKKSEGDLSKIRASLVSEKTLSFIFEQIGLSQFIVVGAGLKGKKPTNAMMCDAFEAVVGAIYLDGGFEKANNYVLNLLKENLNQIKKSGVPESNKSKLQEKFCNQSIVYSTHSQGEGELKTYQAKVLINGIVCGSAEAQKKKVAEDMAAKQALENTKRV